MSNITLVCTKCEGTGKKPDGSQCLCYLFGGPIKRFDKELWRVGRGDEK